MRLTVIKGTHKDRFEIDGDGVYSLGRGRNCTFILRSGEVSRKHSEIIVENQKAFICDLGSKNGTHVNQKRIDKVPLEGGESIRMADITLRFEVEPDENQAISVPHQDPTPTPADDQFAVASGAAELPAVLESQPLAEQVSEPIDASTSKVEKSLLASPLIRVAIIFVAVLVIIAAVLALLPKPPPPTPPKEVFFKKLNQSATLFQRNDFAEAEKTLNEAIPLVSNNQAAHVFLDFIRVWRNSGEQYEELDWVQAENLAIELISIEPSTDDIEILAKQKLTWLKKEEPHMRLVYKVKTLSSQRSWGKALIQLEKLPEDCELSKNYLALFEKVRSEHKNSLLRDADLSFEDGEWESAIEQYQILEEMTLPQTQSDKVARNIQLSHRYILERGLYSQAREEFKKQQYESAIKLIGQIRTDSPFYESSHALKQTVANTRDIIMLKGLYDSGEAESALKFLTHNEVPNSEPLKAKITEILSIHNSASESLKTREIAKAVALWRSLLENEPSNQNFYHSKAKEMLTQWGDSRTLGLTYKEWADEAYRKKDYLNARKYYEIAKSFQKSLGSNELRNMSKRGSLLFNRAFNMITSSPDAAHEILEEVLQLLSPDSSLYDEARQLYIQTE